MRAEAVAESSPLGRIGLPIVLFVLALVPRVHDLGAPSLSTDEVKWIRRGERMIARAREGEILRATAHLSHPGIPPAALIGLSRRWGRRIAGEADPVVLARAPLALVGAAMPALVYVVARPLWGVPVGALAGVLLALDPRHVAASRTAHLDVAFGLFYGLALWAFWRRSEPDEGRGKGVLGAIGALALALAEATRTSGVVAALTIVLVTGLARLRRGRSPIEADELRWLVLAGALFLLVFGKLWLPPAQIPTAERYPRLAAVERALEGASARPLVVGGTATALLGIGAVLRRRVSGLAAAAVGVALGAGLLAPDLVRNVAGFTSNLLTSPERLHHRYYGEVGAALPGKYLTVLLEGLPLPVFLALLLGFAPFALRSWADGSARGRAGVALSVAIVIFLVIASQLDKIAFRYLMPIQPMLLIVAAWGLVQAIRAVPGLGARTGAAVAVIAVALAIGVLPAAPHFATWESAAGRGLRSAIGIRSLIGAEGHDAAAAYLWDHATSDDRIASIAYDDVLRHYWSEVLPVRRRESAKPMPAIGYYRVDEADYLVLSARRRPTLDPPWRRFVSGEEPVLRVIVAGESALEVYDVAAARARKAAR